MYTQKKKWLQSKHLLEVLTLCVNSAHSSPVGGSDALKEQEEVCFSEGSFLALSLGACQHQSDWLQHTALWTSWVKLCIINLAFLSQ